MDENGKEEKAEEQEEILNPLDDVKPAAPAEEVDLDAEEGEKELEEAGVI